MTWYPSNRTPRRYSSTTTGITVKRLTSFTVTDTIISHGLKTTRGARSADYEVRYVRSKSPVGPIDPSESRMVVCKKPDQGIYATGHQSFLQVPGTDEWYIVYHRFKFPDGITMGREAGYHREVCMDRVFFNEDGTIKQVVPSL